MARDNAARDCPVFTGSARRVHRAFEDPPPPHVGSNEERMAVFRRVRDEIREWMRGFVGRAKQEGDA